jgi:hypothetical protein
MKNPYVGKWRINEMEQWDKDFIDLVVPGHITIKKDGLSNFQFGAVEGNIDYRIEKCGDVERLGNSPGKEMMNATLPVAEVGH